MQSLILLLFYFVSPIYRKHKTYKLCIKHNIFSYHARKWLIITHVRKLTCKLLNFLRLLESSSSLFIFFQFPMNQTWIKIGKPMGSGLKIPFPRDFTNVTTSIGNSDTQKKICLHFKVIIFVHCTHFTTLHLLILRHWKMPKHTLFTALGTGRLSLTSWVQGCLEDASSIKFLTKLVLGFSQYDQVIA